jgi:hypothetical protein
VESVHLLDAVEQLGPGHTVREATIGDKPAVGLEVSKHEVAAYSRLMMACSEP